MSGDTNEKVPMTVPLFVPQPPMTTSKKAEKLERLVRELALPGGRMVGTEGHDEAAFWVQSQLEQLELEPYNGREFQLPYTWEDESFTNFAGVIPGRDRSLPPMLIGAHYDSVIPHPCADDNAAAVAITLCAAVELAQEDQERDIVIAIFDAEEPPHFQEPSMGSVRFCEDQADERGFHTALIMDLVGHDVRLPKFGALTPPAIRNLLVIQGAESHPGLAKILGDMPSPQKLNVIAAHNDYMADMSDHYAFRAEGTPFLFFSCGQWEHYHCESDTPEKLNYKKMARISELLVNVASAVAKADLSAEVPDDDFTVELEAVSIQKALGPLLRFIGVKSMRSRADVDAFANELLANLTTPSL